jgi:hypothetical protein
VWTISSPSCRSLSDKVRLGIHALRWTKNVEKKAKKGNRETS